MPEEAGFFRFSLGRDGVLLPSSGWGLAALPDPAALFREGAGEEELHLSTGRYRCLRLERLFEGLSPGLSPPPPSAIPTVFFPAGSGSKGNRNAFLADRDFEVLSLPLSQLRLPPSSLRTALRRRGLAAIRFIPGAMDLVLDPLAAWNGMVPRGGPA